MGQYYPFGEVAVSTVAERVKALWINLITGLKLDEEISDIQKIPSNASMAKLQALADKADTVLKNRKDPNTGVFNKALTQAVQGEAVPSLAPPPAQPASSASSNLPWIFGGLALVAVIVSIVKK